MSYKGLLILLLCCFWGIEMDAQSIRFYHMELDDAIDLAKRKNKKIFIDTYAPWCIPCKRMNKVFREKELGTYFNEHFINVKINMDEPSGRPLYLNYNVVFLPTLLILDKNGYVLHRAERELSARELLRMAKMAQEPALVEVDQTPNNVENPDPSPPVEIIVEEKELIGELPPADILITQEEMKEYKGENKGEEKILYRLDGSSQQIPPDFLYQEAYFRLQLMDGSHRKTVDAYLATQSDWATPKNLQFIFDFLYTTDSKEFQYLVENREAFEALLGAEKVKRSLEIVIYNRLQNGYPRPDLAEATRLYSYIDKQSSEVRAHQYMLQRLHLDKKYDEYALFAEAYLAELNPTDDLVIHNLVRIKTLSVKTENELKELILMMQHIVKDKPNNFYYHFTLAELFFIKRDKSRASAEAAKAMKLAVEEKANSEAIQELIQKIQDL